LDLGIGSGVLVIRWGEDGYVSNTAATCSKLVGNGLTDPRRKKVKNLCSGTQSIAKKMLRVKEYFVCPKSKVASREYTSKGHKVLFRNTQHLVH
jgi:hypothetical protein